jgi:APA family basic amino acid/polyamine antiporter
MIPARILFGISRDGYFVEKGTRINKGGTPIIALYISTLLALVLIIIGSFEVLFSFATIMSVIIWGLAYCSLLKLRIKEPNLERPYRSFFYPWSTLFMILSTIALLAGFAYSDSLNFIIIILIICISYPIYLVVNGKNQKAEL